MALWRMFPASSSNIGKPNKALQQFWRDLSTGR
jgi:hypothetical protein